FAFLFPTRTDPAKIIESDVQVFLGNGDGTFQPAQTYTVSDGNPIWVAVADLNGDGIFDLIVVDGGNSAFPGQTVSILLGNGEGTVGILLGYGDGTFQAPRTYAAGGSSSSLGLGDFNGDGFLDIAVGANGGVTILLNAADWGGGHAALPFLRPTNDEAPLESVLAERAVSDPQAFGLMVPTAMDLQP